MKKEDPEYREVVESEYGADADNPIEVEEDMADLFQNILTSKPAMGGAKEARADKRRIRFLEDESARFEQMWKYQCYTSTMYQK